MMESITSDIPGFTGTIKFKEFITLDLVENFLEADRDKISPREERSINTFAAMCAWVEEWQIENQPAHPTYRTYRATPYIEAVALTRLVKNAIIAEITGIRTIPNVSGSVLTDTPKAPTNTTDPQS